MENQFDELTKALAGGLSRRQALRRMAGLFGAALLGSLAFGSNAQATWKPCVKGACPNGEKCIFCGPLGSYICCPNGQKCGCF